MFHGSIVALITPMTAEGVIDTEALQRLVEWHIKEGTNAIVVLGSTGEAATVTHGERKLIIEQALAAANGRIPIIAGTGTNATASTIELTREAMELGVDACLLVTPYYNKPTQEGLYLHYRAVAEAVAVPQILYNVPSRTACDLKPATVARLAALPNIIGLKEATGDINRLREIRSLVEGQAFDLYSGDDPTALEFMLNGGRGDISITSNLAPKLMRQMCDHALAGEVEQAKAINERLKDLHVQTCVETNPIPTKWALHQMGRIAAGIRLPLTPLSEACHGTVRAAMVRAGIHLAA